MPQYDNPASFMADPATASNIPGVEGALVGIRQRQSAPFLEMFQQQMQMETQQKKQELQEFMSPLGQQQRQADKQKFIDMGNVYHETMGDEIAKSHEAARLLPYMTEQNIADAKVHAQQSAHTLASEPSMYFSGLAKYLQQNVKSETEKATIYNNAVKNSGYDRNKLDPELQQYGPTTMGHLSALRYAQIWTPQLEQKLTEQVIPSETSKAVARINVAGAIAETDRRIKAGQFDSDQHMTAALEKAIATGKDPQTDRVLSPQDMDVAKSQLRRYKGAKVLDAVQKDPLYSSAAIMAMTGDPKAKQAALQAQEEATNRAMRTLGIRPEDLGQTPQQPQKAKYSMGQAVSIGGIRHAVTRIGPDGTAYVNVNGKERPIK